MANKLDSFIEIVDNVLRRIFCVVAFVLEDSCFDKDRDALILICSSDVALRIVSDHVDVSDLIPWITAKCP